MGLHNVPGLRTKCTRLILSKLNGICPTVPLCLPSLRQGCLSCLWPPVCSTLSLALEPRTALRSLILGIAPHAMAFTTLSSYRCCSLVARNLCLTLAHHVRIGFDEKKPVLKSVTLPSTSVEMLQLQGCYDRLARMDGLGTLSWFTMG